MERRIKITYMIDVLDTDMAGTENQLIKMINGLDKRRFQVELVCLRDHPWFSANASSLDCASRVIEVHIFKRLSTYVNFFRLVAYLKRSKPDIVHTFFPVSNIVGVLAARMAGISNTVSSRRDYGEWMTGKYLFATKIADRFVKKILANSTAVKRLTCSKEEVKSDKVDVIYNGIDPKKFQDLKPDLALKRELNIPEAYRVVGIVANFRPMKNHHTFIRAAAELLKSVDGVFFLLVGCGPLEDELHRLGRELEIEDKLCFAGAQSDITRYLSIMDIGVNCSEGEGLSNAIMEYMASGVPCIVAEAGGNTDLITHDINGYTFKLNDYGTLSLLMRKLLTENAVRERLKKNAKATIESRMLLDVILSNYAVFYQGLLDARD